jgi:hypothetical protein
VVNSHRVRMVLIFTRSKHSTHFMFVCCVVFAVIGNIFISIPAQPVQPPHMEDVAFAAGSHPSKKGRSFTRSSRNPTNRHERTTTEELSDVKDLFFIYDDPRMVQANKTKRLMTTRSSPTLRERFGEEAIMENRILEFLANSSLRTTNISEASIFLIPFRVGANIIARTPRGPRPVTFGELVSALEDSEHWRQGKPHVLLALNTIAFNAYHHVMEHVDGYGLTRDFYRRIKAAIVVQSVDNIYVARASRDGLAKGHDYEDFFTTNHSMSQRGFSIGLLPSNNLPYIPATYDKFRSAKNFIFYHTRVAPSDYNSTPYRKAPVEVADRIRYNSSIGLGLPPDAWLKEFSDSQFCLAIRGDTPHTHALLNAVKVGCIPVVVSDFYPLYAATFASSLKMENYCIFIPEKEFMIDPAESLNGLGKLSESEIRVKLDALAFAQRVVLIDHPETLFGHAFVREAVAASEQNSSMQFSWY